ncbi:MAG TPA: HIRAN domain-containing protein [Pedococcus sp.]
MDGLPASVVADPGNPYDPTAVAVWVEDQHVGFLPRDDAAAYFPALADLAERGEHLRVEARVWAMENGRDIRGSVTVVLPPPDGVQSFNEPPEEPYQVLPHGAAMQVTCEDQHMDVLGPYVSDRDRHVAVSLHAVEIQKTPRSAPYRAVEVRLGGQRVGELTKAMSEKVIDVVDFIDAKGRTSVCRAVLKGSPLRAELTLQVAKAHEVTRRWLDAIEEA